MISEANVKKAELRELDDDLRRLKAAAAQFDEFENSGKIIFLGLGSVLSVCGIFALSGSYYLAVKNEFGIVFSCIAFVIALVFLYFGGRFLMAFFKLRNTLRRTAEIIKEVKERKTELEREISLFAE